VLLVFSLRYDVCLYLIGSFILAYIPTQQQNKQQQPGEKSI
jgi:hypothetical protein